MARRGWGKGPAILADMTETLNNIRAAPVTGRARNLALVVAAALCLGLSALLRGQAAQVMALAAGVTLVLLTAGLFLRDRFAVMRESRKARRIAEIVGEDASPCFLTDAAGQIADADEAVVRRSVGRKDRGRRCGVGIGAIVVNDELQLFDESQL
mgnify:CR=1 FL=1